MKSSKKYNCLNPKIGWYCPEIDWCWQVRVNTNDPPPCEAKEYFEWRVKTVYGFCMDCEKDVHATDENYALENKIWKRINPKTKGKLCFLCAEKRLGRELKLNDFKGNVPINEKFFRI